MAWATGWAGVWESAIAAVPTVPPVNDGIGTRWDSWSAGWAGSVTPVIVGVGIVGPTRLLIAGKAVAGGPYPDFTLKQGETSRVLSAHLVDEAGESIDLTGAAVRFRMQGKYSPLLDVDRAAQIVDVTAGQVRVNWQALDLALAGDYDAAFVVTFADGSVLSVPDDGCALIRIVFGLQA